MAVSLDDEKVGWGIFTLDQVGWLERKVCAQTLIYNNASTSIATPLPDPGTATHCQSLSSTSTGKKERQLTKYSLTNTRAELKLAEAFQLLTPAEENFIFPESR